MGPEVELRNLKWVFSRTKAIVEIGKEQGLGLTVARNTYEKINEFVSDGIYKVDSNSSFDDRNYICFLERLKKQGILDYYEFDYHREEQIEHYRVEAENRAKDIQWLNEQPKEHQEIINRLIQSASIVIA